MLAGLTLHLHWAISVKHSK
uniref:Uncharacterized protein n=1 Tax=Anguilla anguilla TaxID=7936 RepID=A0A0E9XQZ4_ANGAN